MPEMTLWRCQRRAMATGFEVVLPLGVPDAVAAAEEALDLLGGLEAQMTVYREDSDVSRFNRFAAISPMPVEPRLFALLQRAARIHHDTAGAYDIAVGALIKAWGFYGRQGRVPSETERAAALKCCGMNNVVLDPQRQTIHYRTAGVELNLGSIGKGYALDCMAELLRNQWNVHRGLIHGGTSSVLALSTPPDQQRGWPVGLGHPDDMTCRLGVVWLRDQALGTSSSTFQHLTHEGRKLGHILDPRTGWPAEQFASVSVVAPSAAEADALATAFFVLPLEQTRVYCEKHPEVGAVLLSRDRAIPETVGNVEFT